MKQVGIFYSVRDSTLEQNERYTQYNSHKINTHHIAGCLQTKLKCISRVTINKTERDLAKETAGRKELNIYDCCQIVCKSSKYFLLAFIIHTAGIFL